MDNKIAIGGAGNPLAGSLFELVEEVKRLKEENAAIKADSIKWYGAYMELKAANEELLDTLGMF